MYASWVGTLCALDATSGKSLWCDHLKDGGVETGLTYANGVLYGATASALLALNAQTGKVAWTVLLTNPDSYSQILVTDTLIYVESSSSSPQEGILQALDVHSGQLRWRFENPVLTDDSVLENGTLYVAGEALHALNAQTGKQLWEVPLIALSTSLALAYGRLYLGTRTDTTTIQFQALDLKSGQVVWSQTIQGGQSACDLFVADHVVYLCTENSATEFGDPSYYWIDALDTSSGAPLRKFVSGSSSFAPGELVVADSHIYISGEDLGFGGGETLEVWG